MPVKRRRTKRRYEGLAEEVEAHFLGDPTFLFNGENELRALWQQWGGYILADWIAANPGTRPCAWWRYNAPEPRRRIGGTGTALHDCLGYAEHYEYGLPASGFLDQFMFEYYNGVAHDIHGNLIANGRTPGDFPHAPFDPNDPPTFESEAEYLARLGLLFDGEAARCQ